MATMPRWDPQAEERLRDAALGLFLERGYDNVTVAQITERAGLTRRTFSRYFTDKRDVVFAGSEQLPPALADRVLHADGALPAFGALVTGLTDAGELLASSFTRPAEQRAVIEATPELQERQRTKFAAVTDALAGALRQRGAAEAEAMMLARVGTAIFQTAFEQWAQEPERAALAACIRATAAGLAASLGALASPAVPSSDAMV
jgi:AcrR family transcriptional regulator